MGNYRTQLVQGRAAPILPMWFLLLSLLLLWLSALLTPALAQEPVSDDAVNEVAKEVYCPVCENTPLDVCETKACADWRELIRTKLGEGETKQQIFDYFAAQYGDRVLASPPKEGFNLILWTWPIFALVLGGALFARYLRNLRTAGDQSRPVTSSTPISGPAAAEEDYIARIEKELSEQ